MDGDPAQPHHTNRLARESSPYLLQHQHNPVDWYPWGPQAFAEAARLDKPIFLSVGYSTCYWCHVMERQCFENPAIAAEMNRRFVNIKVDREERPDVDALYMTGLQVLTRHGGWPMSLFLTPDLRPFYGGTYFPPEDQPGRPGFRSLLVGIEDAYRNRRSEVDKSAGQLVDMLQRLAQPAAPAAPLTLDDSVIEAIMDRSVADYDATYGGFGAAPKFPRQTLLQLLLTHQRHQPNPQRMRMLQHTLDAMAAGGVRDHLGGGFHRYSTDAQWLTPHFEIMLYDNALLAWVYAEAFQQTGRECYATIARGICDFVLREMTSPHGAFYTAFDAEVNAQEGESYLWTAEEIIRLLGPEDATLFTSVYGLDLGPNFADPHHGDGLPDKNILYLPEPFEVVAGRFNLTVQQLAARLAPLRRTLHAARLKRRQPLLDTKIITSWNALMIRALAHAGRILVEPCYHAASVRAAEYLLAHHCQGDVVYRVSRDGVAKYRGFLDDYAFLAQALLELDAGAGVSKDRWVDEARSLASVIRDRFAGAGGGLFFSDAEASDLVVRQQTAADSPLPSGNAVAALLFLALGMPDAAHEIIAAFAASMAEVGEGMSSMLQAANEYLRRHGPVAVAAGAQAEEDRPLSPQQLAERVVTMAASWVSPSELHLRLSILRGFHINAHETSAGLVPTEVAVAGPDAALVAGIDYPAGQERRLAIAERPLRVYEGNALIVIRFNVPRAGPDPLDLMVRFQTCDDKACLPVVTRSLSIAIT